MYVINKIVQYFYILILKIKIKNIGSNLYMNSLEVETIVLTFMGLLQKKKIARQLIT